MWLEFRNVEPLLLLLQTLSFVDFSSGGSGNRTENRMCRRKSSCDWSAACVTAVCGYRGHMSNQCTSRFKLPFHRACCASEHFARTEINLRIQKCEMIFEFAGDLDVSYMQVTCKGEF